MMTSTNGKPPTSSETVLKSKRRRISVAEKIRILKAFEAAAPGKQGAVLRRKGIYSSQVSAWRRQLERGDLDPATMRRRENRGLRRRIERAELIGEIQKAARLLGMDIESRENNDDV